MSDYRKIDAHLPTGSHVERLPHPSGESDREIELAIFKDHRLSFFFWYKWSNKLKREGRIDAPPLLVTIDWHRDLAPPNSEEREMLEPLDRDPDNLDKIARFASEELDHHNDGHLLSAVWLNLIGDVILLKNYGLNQSAEFSDLDGNRHKILEFKGLDSFQSELLSRQNSPVFLDMDLDYFIKNKVVPYQRKNVELYRDEEIREIIDPENDHFRLLLPEIAGFTIATEPRYCGGVRNSNHILKVVLDQLFDGELGWKHLG